MAVVTLAQPRRIGERAMHSNFKQLTDFLMQLGVADIGHTNKSYLAHLVGVYRDMEVGGCTEEVCQAGMFHSIYGTQQFQGFTLPLERRPEIASLIGERAERLAYLNCAMDRPSFDRALEQADEPYRFADRLAGQEVCLARDDFDDLCRVHLFDWLEQVPRSRLGWGWRRAAYRRMATRLAGPALEAYNRVFSSEPAPCS
jgi:hypothetical protein